VSNIGLMPKTRRALGGRPRIPRLPPRASTIIRGELDRALIENRKPAAFLAGSAAGTERNERTVRQDLADRGGLKLEAALFLVRRAFKTQLLEYRTYFRLRALIELCHPQARDLTSAGRFAISGGFFMATDLEGAVFRAIEEALPRLRDEGRRAVFTAVNRVLAMARSRAHKAGVPQAYAEQLHRDGTPPSLVEMRTRAQAYSWARKQLGNEAINIVIEDDATLYHQTFLDD